MKQKKLSKSKIICIITFVGILLVGSFLMGVDDSGMILEWWLLSLLLGFGTYPLAKVLLGWMADRGYFASKILNILFSGWVTWLICYAGIPYITVVCWIVLILVSGACWGIAIWKNKKDSKKYIQSTLAELAANPIVWVEEVIYFGMFMFWLYAIGFRPEAFGTERLMDYGFMAAILKGKTIPATDMWYSDGILNYYYGGQYYVTYLIRLCMTPLKYAYNVYRSMLPALTFVMTFNIVLSLFNRTYKKDGTRKDGILPYLAGTLGGSAMTFAANGHFILFYKFIPMIQDMLGVERKKYWFSDSTRYIGHWPEMEDKTIHEYPAYSFLLGDLHAHVINIMFILLFLAVLMQWCFNQNPMPGQKKMKAKGKELLKEVLQPEILMLSFLVGIFKWTNFWDFAIYFGLSGLIILMVNIRNFEKQPITIAVVTALQAVAALVISELVTLPFTLDFDSMFQGAAFTNRHSAFYQLVVLWGIPVLSVVLFWIHASKQEAKTFRENNPKRKFVWTEMDLTTLFTFVLGLYAIIMIIVPEVVYVKDIYGDGYSRSNTMFKFAYQAFIMFAIVMSYALMRMVTEIKKKETFKKTVSILLILVICTVGYLPAGIKLWFGDITKVSNFRGTNALRYLVTEVPNDESAILWLDENVKESAVVLETDGVSYTKKSIVSGVTGLPTVLGWYVHEWLWRNDKEDLNHRKDEIYLMYTSSDVELVRSLMEKYNVSYVFVGSNEWDNYKGISTGVLDQLGEVVFRSESVTDGYEYPPTCIYKINRE